VSPAANLPQRLIFPLVAKLSRPGTDHLPHDLPGYAQLPADRFDGLALLKKRAADLCNRLHDQHPNLGFQESRKPMWTLCSGVPIGSRSPRKGGPFCMPIHSTCQVLRPRRAVRTLRWCVRNVLPSALETASAPGDWLSRLNGWPMPSPTDASSASLRTPTHGSGPMWIATPSS